MALTRIKNLILKHKLNINNQIINNPSKKVNTGDEINFIIPEPQKASLKPYKYKLVIEYEDEDLIIINKPSHMMPTHA